MGSNADHLHGISYYASLAGCLRRAHLPVEDGGADADYGTAVHKWLNAYHEPNQADALPQVTAYVALGLTAPGKGCTAQTLVDRYAARFRPEDLGVRVLGETRLRMPLSGEDCRCPEQHNEAREQAVENGCDVVGNPWEEPFAGTLDHVGVFDEALCERWQSVFGVTLLPGAYLVDFKTKVAHSATLVPQYLVDPQFTGYHLLWEAWRGRTVETEGGPVTIPDLPLQGTLVLFLFRYKEAKEGQFLPLLVPPPDRAAIAILKGLVHDGAERLRRYGPQHCTPTACWEWYRACPGMDLGCPRTNLGDMA